MGFFTYDDFVPYLKGMEAEHSVAQYDALDRISERFPGRLVLVLESASDEEMAQREENEERTEEERTEVGRLIYEGKFEEALELYKELSVREIDDFRGRESNVVKAMKNVIGEDDVVACVVAFGSAHTTMAHVLRKGGHNVIWGYDEKVVDDTYWHDPSAALIRKLVSSGKDSVSEIEWFRAMLGEKVYSYVRAIGLAESIISEEDISQTLVIKTKDVLRRKLSSMDDVKMMKMLFEMNFRIFGKSKPFSDFELFKMISRGFTLKD